MTTENTTENKLEAEKVPVAKTVNDAVLAKLAEANSTIVDIVAKQLAQVEIIKRTEILTKAINEITTLRGGLHKYKPAKIGVKLDGTPVFAEYITTEMAESKKKDEERLAKLDGACRKAVESNDWSKLYEIFGK